MSAKDIEELESDIDTLVSHNIVLQERVIKLSEDNDRFKRDLKAFVEHDVFRGDYVRELLGDINILRNKIDELLSTLKLLHSAEWMVSNDCNESRAQIVERVEEVLAKYGE